MKDRGGTERFVDTASCIVRLKQIFNAGAAGLTAAFDVKKIHNTTFIMEKQKCPNGCSCVYMNKDYCTGPLNIKGVQAVQIINDGKKAAVTFTPASAMTPLFQISCPRVPVQYVPSMTLIAGPLRVEFELKDGQQEQDFDESTSIIGKMKIVVNRLTE